METRHICQPEFSGLPDMAAFYRAISTCATSENGDVALIRSHIAYWAGSVEAERAVIKPSRGHTYKVDGVVVRITDHHDHREGVTGLGFSECENRQLALWGGLSHDA